jgi:hypothetical protein
MVRGACHREADLPQKHNEIDKRFSAKKINQILLENIEPPSMAALARKVDS